MILTPRSGVLSLRMLAAAVHTLILAIAVHACSSDSTSTPAGSDSLPAGSGVPTTIDTKILTFQLVPTQGTSTPLGTPFGFTLSIHNSGPRSITVPVDLTLEAPDGTSVSFYTTSLFVPYGKESTEDVLVTPAQWFSTLGRFDISVTADRVKTATHLGFDVVEADSLVPTFDEVSKAAGVRSSVPPPTCGQFSNGAAWGDVDDDGDPDLFATRLGETTQLFINDGAGSFTEQGAARGVSFNDANGAAFADYDNDGDADLVVLRDASDLLFDNDGSGTFTDVSEKAGIGEDNYRGMSASWGDYDSDGNLDLYVTNYMHCLGEWETEEQIIAQVGYYPDRLFHSNGDGTFSDVTPLLEKDSSTYNDGTTLGAGFTAVWFDYNRDNRPDLYLANDFVGPSPDHNRMWRNDGPAADGGWIFTDVSLDSGTAFFMNTMGIGVADVDRDDDLDLALSNITANKLVRNNGDGTFVEDLTNGSGRPTQVSGIASVTWGANFYDLNLDGWEDLYFGAGNLQQAPGVPVGVQPNELYLNDGTGETFLDVSAATGADDPGDSKGVAFADYDSDGDMDMYVTNQGGESHLFENVTPHESNHWLEVDPVGSESNRDGCGALVTVTTESGSMQRPVLCGSGGPGSANQRIVHFGLGIDSTISRLEVLWPSGAKQVLTDIDVDQVLKIEEPPA